jgi:hypothetical protein
MYVEVHLFNIKKVNKTRLLSIFKFVGDFLEGTLDRTRHQLVTNIYSSTPAKRESTPKAEIH